MDFEEFTPKKPLNGAPHRASMIVERENPFPPSESGRIMNDYSKFIIGDKTEVSIS